MPRFRIMNEKGEFVANYDNESEVRTFLKASVEQFDDDAFQLSGQAETEVVDSDEQPRFLIHDSQPQQRTAKRTKKDNEPATPPTPGESR